MTVRLTPGDRFELENIHPADIAKGVILLDPGLLAILASGSATILVEGTDSHQHDPDANDRRIGDHDAGKQQVKIRHSGDRHRVHGHQDTVSQPVDESQSAGRLAGDGRGGGRQSAGGSSQRLESGHGQAEDGHGQPLPGGERRATELAVDFARNALVSDGFIAPQGRLVLECVSAQPLRFVLLRDPAPANAAPGTTFTSGEKNSAPGEHRVSVPRQATAPATGLPTSTPAQSAARFFFSDQDRLLLTESSFSNTRLIELELSLMGSRLGMVSGFDDLLALPMLRDVEPLEYQRKTVLKVLRQFRGRALLADEVGLGKTIEACLVLLELVVRRLVRKVLILTPPSLIEQWEGELRRKFGLHFTSFDAEEFKEQGDAAWSRFSHVLASFHTAKRDPHRSAVLAQEWDMVIVDEAHHLRNRSTLLWKLASSLKTKYMLLLTATPVQNSVEDLHSLVTVLKPGLLRTPKDFHRRFTDRADRLMPKNLPELNRLVADVMVRNRRGTTGVAFTRRTAHTQAVSLFLPEREMYAGVSRVVRQALREHTGLSRMALLTLQKELGSSTRAAAATLRKLASEPRLGHALRVELQDLASAASLISGSAKLDRLAELVSSFPGKMLIFTQFRETQSAIMERLSAEGVPAVQFHGGLSRLEKEEVVRRFQEETRVMVATDAGSEGRNLQFCNAICNFDLPWNPMRIEQRIGRLSRIGQQRDVEVFNLVATDTLEAAILHLLEAKIAMFELVVGEIDMIIGTMDEEKQFEEIVADLWISTKDDEQFAGELDLLGERLLKAKEAYTAQKAMEDALFGEELGIKA